MSPGTDTLIQNAVDGHNMPALFAALPVLRDLAGDLLGEITREIEWFSLPGGTTLFSIGQPSDGLYVIINGALGVYVPRVSGGSQLVARLCGGQVVGESELVSGSTRAATVVALHDTEVARLPTASFEQLVARNPLAMREIAKVLVRRLESAPGGYQQARTLPKTFALVPQAEGVDAVGFGRQLLSFLKGVGRAELVTHSMVGDRTSHWFHRLERANEYVVYITDSHLTNWSKRCLRQADAVVLVAHADSSARPWTIPPSEVGEPGRLQVSELVLLHRAGAQRSATRQWMKLYGCRHHHVISSRDVARVARLLTGNAVGLVLSGGGARGFAHIGVIRALREANVPIDAVGATSIGSIIGAGLAVGWDHQEMVERIRHSFVDTNPMSDFTFPLMSLVSGRKVGRLLRREFGAACIEDLRLPYFCVSTNLTRGQAAVHRQGELWLWLRASVAIPGVLPPVIADNQVYVDGATINNLPVDVMREVMDGTILAVDAGADRTFEPDIELTEMPPAWRLGKWRRVRKSRMNIMQILWRAGMVNSEAITIGQRELADLLLKPPTDSINLLDWKAFEQAIELGYRYACKALESWERSRASQSHRSMPHVVTS
jgi:NTE family protein